MTNLKFYEEDPRGTESGSPDPRDRNDREAPQQRSIEDQDRGTYYESNPPANGNRRHPVDNHGTLGNDLESGRSGQKWRGW